MRARLRASFGISSNASGGAESLPLHEYFVGIVSLLPNAELVMRMSRSSCMRSAGECRRFGRAKRSAVVARKIRERERVAGQHLLDRVSNSLGDTLPK